MKRSREREKAEQARETSEAAATAEAHPSGPPGPSKRAASTLSAEQAAPSSNLLQRREEAFPGWLGDDPRPRALAPGLYLVATPIGHLRDITLRALDTLAAADLVLCEDTRMSQRLLSRYGIAARRAPYHEHNAERVRPGILEKLASGQRIALISDAGTPLVSDPGYKLVAACIAAALPVFTVPGPSAPLSALLLSGLPSDRFLFAGFLPSRQGERCRELAELAAVPATLVFFESAQRLARSLADMARILGDRPAAVARELTKLHEEVIRGDLAALAQRYAEMGPPRGEIVVAVGRPVAAPIGEAGLDLRLQAAMRTSSIRDAATEIAAALDLPRRQVYARALELAKAGDAP